MFNINLIAIKRTFKIVIKPFKYIPKNYINLTFLINNYNITKKQ